MLTAAANFLTSVFIEGDADTHVSMATMAVCSWLIFATIGVSKMGRRTSPVRAAASPLASPLERIASRR